jgi:hypothetical protein
VPAQRARDEQLSAAQSEPRERSPWRGDRRKRRAAFLCWRGVSARVGGEIAWRRAAQPCRRARWNRFGGVGVGSRTGEQSAARDGPEWSEVRECAERDSAEGRAAWRGPGAKRRGEERGCPRSGRATNNRQVSAGAAGPGIVAATPPAPVRAAVPQRSRASESARQGAGGVGGPGWAAPERPGGGTDARSVMEDGRGLASAVELAWALAGKRDGRSDRRARWTLVAGVLSRGEKQAEAAGAKGGAGGVVGVVRGKGNAEAASGRVTACAGVARGEGRAEAMGGRGGDCAGTPAGGGRMAGAGALRRAPKGVRGGALRGAPRGARAVALARDGGGSHVGEGVAR